MKSSPETRISNTDEHDRRTPRTRNLTMILILLALLSMLITISAANAQFPDSDSPQSFSLVPALYILGDSSVDCGENTLFYPLRHQNLSLLPCSGDSTLVPQLLAEKMGLPKIPPFYSQNGSIEGVLGGVNFGSAVATILNPSSRQTHQSISQQLRQVYETFQLLQLQLSQANAVQLIKSSIFYLSFGKQDYIDLFLHNSLGKLVKYSGHEFAQILADQMKYAIRNIYDANGRKIVCMGILPLGCTPRVVWEWRNWTAGYGGYGSSCVDEINQLVLEYNIMLEEVIVSLNSELADANFVFCDVYQGMMRMLADPGRYGFEDVENACCGLGSLGAMIGCVSADMACSSSSEHVWWDLYNPTQAVNSYLADSAWFGRSFGDICRPTGIQELVYS